MYSAYSFYLVLVTWFKFYYFLTQYYHNAELSYKSSTKCVVRTKHNLICFYCSQPRYFQNTNCNRWPHLNSTANKKLYKS